MLLLLATPSTGTTFLQVPFEQIVEDAPIMVRGIAQESTTDWGVAIDGTRRIYTYTPIEVDEWLKGQAWGGGSSILVREMGGEKDGVGLKISGTAHFKRGEEVVLTLGKPLDDLNNRRVYDVRGMMMGKYGLKKNADGEIEIVGAVDDDGHNHKEPQPKAGWTLNRLKKLIQDQSDTDATLTPLKQPVEKRMVPKTAETQDNSQSRPNPALAPRLQNTGTEEATPEVKSLGTSFWVLAGLLIALSLVIFKVTRK
jgi:hypothetical protein